MALNPIKCFTDASYSKEKSLCIIGYIIDNSDVKITQLPNIKNTQGELIAIDKCIQECSVLFPNRSVLIYTDCSRALKNNYGDHISIVKIKGHVKKDLRTKNDNIFRIVDKTVRKELRSI